MKSTYELKWFRSSNDKDFVEALQLYVENIEPQDRTDTKEIIYWVDNFNQEQDQFLVLGFYLNRRLIGYCEMAYFYTQKLVIVDYLIIEKSYRANNTFHEFVSQIKSFLGEHHIDFNFIVGEVGCYFENSEPSESSKSIIRLLKISHFGVIKTKYFVPRLGLVNYESEMTAVLMIYSAGEEKRIKKETLLMIVETIYFKYYKKWYDAFFSPNEIRGYSKILNDLFAQIKKFIRNKEFIDINGYQNLLPIQVNFKKDMKLYKLIKAISILLIFVVCVLGVGFLSIYLQKRLGIDINGLSAIFTISVILALLITALFFEKKSNIISGLLEKIVDKL